MVVNYFEANPQVKENTIVGSSMIDVCGSSDCSTGRISSIPSRALRCTAACCVLFLATLRRV